MFPFFQVTWIKCTGSMRSHIGILSPGIVDRHKAFWWGMDTLPELKSGLPFPIDYQVVLSLSGWTGSCCLVYFSVLCIVCTPYTLLFFKDRLLSVSLVLAGFGDQPTPQQLHTQDRYKEELKQQVGSGPQPLIYAGNCLDVNGGLQTKHEML